MYSFNRRTLALLRTQKDSNGEYIWVPGMNGVKPNLILGKPYSIDDKLLDGEVVNSVPGMLRLVVEAA